MNNMAGKMRQEPAAPIGSQAFESTRSALAIRLQGMHRDQPVALDVLAELLRALYSPLHGVATIVASVTSAKRFRESCRGERPLSLDVVAYLATLPMREPREAVLAMVSYLAALLGYRLEPMGSPAAEAHEALAGVVSTCGEVAAGLSLALKNDGVIDADEAEDLEPKITAAEQELARLRATASQARNQRVLKVACR